MALLGHVSAEMSLRYGRLFDATVRDEYERALPWPRPSSARCCPDRPHPAAARRHHRRQDWRDAPLIKARLAGGYCLRAPAQGACAYANICEHCPNFRTDTSFLAVLAAQRADAAALAADAEHRGWAEEAARHRRLIDRLDLLIDRAAHQHEPTTPRRRVEAACAELLAAERTPITFDAVAARAGIGRATLYRRPELRAVIEEHRQQARDALTLTGLRPDRPAPRHPRSRRRQRPPPRRTTPPPRTPQPHLRIRDTVTAHPRPISRITAGSGVDRVVPRPHQG